MQSKFILKIVLLDSVNVDYWVFVVIGIILILVWLSLNSSLKDLREKNSQNEINIVKKDGLLRERDLMITSIQSEIDLKSNEKGQALAKSMYEEFKNKELLAYMKVIEEGGQKDAQNLLAKWLIENEERIRKDAANRSVRNVLGKVTEHLIPFSEAMKNFNPKDIRFIGSPIDLIVFDGAEELKKDEVSIHFIEVKTGTSALSKRQQLVKDAVINKRVHWLRVDMKSFGDDVNAALSE